MQIRHYIFTLAAQYSIARCEQLLAAGEVPRLLSDTTCQPCKVPWEPGKLRLCMKQSLAGHAHAVCRYEPRG